MAATEVPDQPPVEDVLAREAEGRSRAGLAAIAAGLLVLIGGAALSLIYSDIPRVLLVDAIRDTAGQSIGRPGLLSAKIHFYDDKAVALVAVSVVQALGAVGTGYALLYLFDATAARRPATPRLLRLGVLFGAAATAIGYLALQITAAVLAHRFATGSDQSTAAAHDALRSSVLVVAQLVGFLGTLFLAFSFVLVSLNAMRAGLLTRFMGVLGIITGVLLVIPIGSQLPIVQAFWLVALGMLILGRWPSEVPAWTSGRAVPWPTAQEAREARQRQAGGGGPAPRPEPSTDAPSPATSKKRKRKRRA